MGSRFLLLGSAAPSRVCAVGKSWLVKIWFKGEDICFVWAFGVVSKCSPWAVTGEVTKQNALHMVGNKGVF